MISAEKLQRSAWIYRVCAKDKLTALLCLSVSIACINQLAIGGLALGGACLLVVFSRLPSAAFIPFLLRINIFFFFLFCTMPIAIQGLHDPAVFTDSIFSLGAVSFSATGLRLAALATIKGNTIALLVLVLSGSSSFSANCQGLLQLGMPRKLIMLLQLVFRYIDSLRREYHALYTAARLRGFSLSWRWATYRTIAYLIAMLFVRTADTMQRVEKAMRLRGFSGEMPLFADAGTDGIRGRWLVAGAAFSSCSLLAFNWGIGL